MNEEGDSEEAKLAAEFAVFREDVVRSRVAEDTLLGVVEGVGGHSDSEEDDHEYEELAKGSARVSWYKKADNPATVLVESLEVVDRALLHHDVVARKSAPLGQAGYVTAVDVKCTVRFLATGEVMEGVDSRLLQQVQPLKQVRRLWSTARGARAGGCGGVLRLPGWRLCARARVRARAECWGDAHLDGCSEAGHVRCVRALAGQGGRGHGSRHCAHARRFRVPRRQRRPGAAGSAAR